MRSHASQATSKSRRSNSTSSSVGSLSPEGEGHFRFALPLRQLNTAEEIVREVRDGENVSYVLRRMGQLRAMPGYTLAGRALSLSGTMTPCESRAHEGFFSNRADTGSDLVFFYLHFELDDVMLLAQLWQLKKEKCEMNQDPIIVWAVSYTDLASENLFFEKKQLMASMLGVRSEDIFMLLQSAAGDLDDSAGQGHPMTEKLRQRRDETISNICEVLMEYPSSLVHLYISAPCNGNFGAIRDYLRGEESWPPKAKWKVHMYTGSYNIRGHHVRDADIEALQDLVSDANPLVDVSRYFFFGGEGAHPIRR